MSSIDTSTTLVKNKSSNNFFSAQQSEQLEQNEESVSIATSALSLVTSDIHSLSDSLNSLSFDFYDIFMSKLNKNVVFAPFSISSLITMCYFSADDKTKEEISKLLHLKTSANDTSEIEQMLIILFNLLKKISKNNFNRNMSIISFSQQPSELSCPSVIDQDIKLEINSSIYCRTGYLLDKFKNNLVNLFNADILFENMESSNFEKLLKKVNYNPRKLTNKNINEMLLDEHLNENIFMLMINTLQFEAQWKFEINTNHEIGYFKVDEEKIIEITSIRIPENRYMYVKKPNGLPCKVCEIPFKNESFVFTVILPETNCIEQIETVMTYELFEDIVNQMASKRLNILLPKFQIYDHLDYEDLFKQTTSLIDFTKINSGLGINKSTYKSFIRLCEKGIEASCCSNLSLSHNEITYKNSLREHPSEDFKCDKPFLFFIREKKTKIILFMGKLLIPN